MKALWIGSIKIEPEKRELARGRNIAMIRMLKDDIQKGQVLEMPIVNHPIPIGRENTSTVPKCTTCNTYHPPKVPFRTCFNYNCLGHFSKDCRVVPRNVNQMNARNLAAARRAFYECGSTDHYKSACLRLNRAQGPEGNRPN
ncbi:hypothetical protein Tco_0308768 [Tanacetum coccineum]